MTTGHLLAVAWSHDPTVLWGCVGLLAAYAAWLRRQLTWRAAFWVAGVAVLWLALESPIDRLGELYLFSMHMVQHMLLIQVIPLLLLWALPAEATRRLLRIPAIDRLERAIGRPRITLPLKVLALWVWHLPVLYDLALRNEGVHALEHLVFLVTATMFWWSVLTPVKERRLAPQHAMAHVFGAMAGISILGMVITLAPTAIYPFYRHPPDPYGALELIRNGWGLSVLADQQLGGVIMWIAGGIYYIVVILVEFFMWFAEPEQDELPAAAAPAAGRTARQGTAVALGADEGALLAAEEDGAGG